MPQQSILYRVLVASPSDCVQERKLIPEVIAAWNAAFSLSTSVILEPVLWETHARPAFGDRPQALLNKQLLDHCDILVGTFWTRIGTPTGEAPSGTVEEIERFRKSGKPVLLYFSKRPVELDSVDRSQYDQLVEYRKLLETQGLIFSYEDLAALRAQFQTHLAGQMAALMPEQARTLQAMSDNLPDLEMRSFGDKVAAIYRRYQAEWSSERDSDPYSTDDGKEILGRLLEEVLELLSDAKCTEVGKLPSLMDEIARNIRALQRTEMVMDGGVSFRKFWTEGDRILALVGKAQELVEIHLGVIDLPTKQVDMAYAKEIALEKELMKDGYRVFWANTIDLPRLLEFDGYERILWRDSSGRLWLLTAANEGLTPLKTKLTPDQIGKARAERLAGK